MTKEGKWIKTDGGIILKDFLEKPIKGSLNLLILYDLIEEAEGEQTIVLGRADEYLNTLKKAEEDV
ncbi:hypothetical protein KAW18_02320 [candidate division WOR-3 bacterium]|nr:hypothetical protein [candidate division WOR-3 bacterium]